MTDKETMIGNLDRWAEAGGAFLTREDLWKMRRVIEQHPSDWNAAIEAAAKMLRSNADNCQPGSPAESQNWPFVLETMARAIDGLKSKASSARPEALHSHGPSSALAVELKVLKEVSDDLSLHGHGLAAARVERMIYLLSAPSPLRQKT